MSDNPIDESELGETKEKLAHVEPKTGSSAKPVFKCPECGETQVIPDDILAKMEKDESFDPPKHHDKTMLISVVE